MDLVQFIGRFHVLVLHLPIGILMLSSLAEIYMFLYRKERPKFLNQVWIWGAVSAIAACILGYMLSLGGGYNQDAVFIHKIFGISVALIALICTVILITTKKPRLFVVPALSVIQLLLLFSTGHYGANMTHGETYLVEYAPNFIREIAGYEAHQGPRPAIKELGDADVYLDLIQPLFKGNCVSCHNRAKSKGELNLETTAGILQGGKTASTLGEGNIENSELYKRITMDEHDKLFMPAEGKTPLTDVQVKTIAWWLSEGAPVAGNIQTGDLSDSDRKTLAQALGIMPTKGAWPLPARTEVPSHLITRLQQQGFLVKTIAQDVNYLSVDYSSNLTAISDAAIEALVQAKDYIAYLDLVNSQATEAQISKLSALSNLLKLRLYKVPVTNEGLRSLTGLNNLRHLNLYSTNIDDDSFKTIENFPSLTHLYLGQTGMSKKAIQDLSALNPNINIYGLYEITKLND